MADGEGLAVGDTAPDFGATLVTPGGDAEAVAFSTLLDQRPILLSVYTVDFSPDCVSEWCPFRDFEWFTSTDEVGVVGVSKSGPGVHRKFIDYLDIKFPLCSNTSLAISEAFDVDYRAFNVFGARAGRVSSSIRTARAGTSGWASTGSTPRGTRRRSRRSTRRSRTNAAGRRPRRSERPSRAGDYSAAPRCVVGVVSGTKT